MDWSIDWRHVSMVLASGPSRIAIDSVLIVAVVSGIFWAGKIDQRMSNDEAIIYDHHDRIVALEHMQALYQEHMDDQHAAMREGLATIAANQQNVMKQLIRIDERADKIEMRLQSMENHNR